MECFLVRNGGGAPLNFKVVGNPQPTSPKENTIWINTDTAITDWIFSADQPAAAVGRVWIKTGPASQTDFNAVKKNGIQVYPISARQYVSGTWQDKTAQIYQSGKWVNLYEWNGQLYELGEEFVSKTGGWTIVNGRSSVYSTGQGTKAETEIQLACNTANTAIAAVTVNKVDLSKYTTLKCRTTNYKQFGRIQVASGQATDGSGVAYADIYGVGTSSLNISNLTGSYYILIATWYASNGATASLHFDKVWLE